MSDKTTTTPKSAAPDAVKSTLGGIANQLQRLSGWLLLAPGEAVQWAAGLSRSTLAWGSLAMATVILLSVNLIASQLMRNVKADLTEEQLFTISNGTQTVLQGIDEPISVQVYYSRQLSEVAPVYAKHFERLKGLLEQYRDISGGNLDVSFIDPAPFSDAEDRATAAGLKGQRLNQEGEMAYFGLVASNTTDNQVVVPFFATERERFLEYDLTKLIGSLANPKKRVVGLITSIPLEGATNPMNPRAPPSPAWMVMDQIREFFEVRPVDPTLTEIPKDIDVLMVAQPTIMTKDMAYAIDQYALSGGRLLVFVDPVAEAAKLNQQPGMASLPVSSEFRKVMEAWGLGFDTKMFAADPTIARRVQFDGNGGQPIVTDYLAWLQVDKAQLNDKDPLAASIRQLNFASAGALTKLEGATTIIQPLIQTTAAGGLMSTATVRFQPDPLTLLRTFKSGGKPLMLAARIGGEAKTAYPQGRPKDKADSDKDKAKDGDKAKAEAGKAELGKAAAENSKTSSKDKNGVDAASAKAASGDGKAGSNQVMAGRVNIVVIADSDLLADHFWVQVRELLGQRVVVPLADNAGFVVNALENLSGSDALASLRGRGVVERPFDRVRDIRRAAELRFRQKEASLVAKLKDLQTKLARVETKGSVADAKGGANAILSDEEKQAIDKFRGEMVTVRRELRDVKAALRSDIDRLDWWLRFFNIAAVPMLIGLGGVGYGLMRRRRNRQAQ